MSAAGRRIADWLAGAVLFAATSAMVLGQNARLTVLWDLSYILENASRIAGGDVPYRDFAMPYAPVTFLVQAAIIRIFGRAIVYHIAWAAVAGGAATVVTWSIIRRLLPDTLVARVTAFLLAAPLAILGIYCIFPHPFYDPDICLALLLMIAALLAAERRGLEPRWAFGAGFLCALLPFIKQNVGLVVLGVVAGGVILLIVGATGARSRGNIATSDGGAGAFGNQRARRRRLTMLLAGCATGSILGLAVVTAVFGFDNYVRWTIRFAAARRLPPLSTQFKIYSDPTLVWWLACALAGGLAILWRAAPRAPALHAKGSGTTAACGDCCRRTSRLDLVQRSHHPRSDRAGDQSAPPLAARARACGGRRNRGLAKGTNGRDPAPDHPPGGDSRIVPVSEHVGLDIRDLAAARPDRHAGFARRGVAEAGAGGHDCSPARCDSGTLGLALCRRE
jgi:hypothetical protein